MNDDTQVATTQFKGLSGFDYCNHALAFEAEISTQFLTLGEYLYNISEQNLYEPQWSSFNEFCNEFRSLSQASISKLVNIYGRLIMDYQIPKEKIAALGGWSNIAEALPVIKSAEDANAWIDKAMTLSRTDLRKEITEHRTGMDMRDCTHQDFYVIKICRTCHDKQRIEDSQDE